MRAELNDPIRAIVDSRFAIENVADCVIRDMRQGHDTKYRGHVWKREHLEAMEKVYLGIEAAWQYAKWLQFPEMESRQEDGFAALSRVMDVQEIIYECRLTDSEVSVASPAAIGRSIGRDGKEPVMARTTVAELEKIVEELQETRVRSLRRLIKLYDSEITKLDVHIAEEFKGHEGYEVIQQLNGVGPVLAAIFCAELGDVERFRSAKAVCSWAGLTPRHRESDTTIHRGSITKQGSGLVRWAAVEAN